MQAFAIFFGAAWMVIVCIALGLLLLRRLSIQLYLEEEIPLAFVSGAACLSAILFVLCAVHLVYVAVFLALGVIILGSAVYLGAFKFAADRFTPLPLLWRRVFLVLFAIFGILYFFHAMAPEMSPDGSTYHLGLVGRYWRNHGFERITTNMYSNLSQGVELLYLFAYGFGRHSAAALVHFAFLIALPLMMLNYGRRFGFPKAGVAGALFFFISPVIGKDGSTAYNDVATACLIFSVFYFLQVWGETRARRLLIPIGLLAGFCYAAKYTAFLAIPYAVVFVFWKLLRSRQPWLKPVLTVIACAVLMMAPWVAKNWIWLDNPFSPFFNAWFPNPYIHQSFEVGYAWHMRHYEGVNSYWDLLLEVTMRGTKLCGLVGPLFFLAPVALLALRNPYGRKLLLAALIFGAIYGTNIGTRFLIPGLPYLSLALALAVSSYRGVALSLVIAHSVLSWPPVMQTYCDASGWKLEKVLWREALRIKSEDEFLRSNLMGYATARMIEDVVPPGEKILTFTNVAEAYTTREILVIYQSASNEILGEMLWTPLTFAGPPTLQTRFSFPSGKYRKLRVLQTAEDAADQWRVSELRIYGKGQELPRDPAWRLRALPNPWDVQRAFDNSPVTRWSTWQPLYNGMFLEVDLGQPEIVDEVALDCPAEQFKGKVRLEGADPNGNWKVLSNTPVVQKIPMPPGLRRAAAAEIKAAGVRYLLVGETDFGREDFQKRQQEWGLKLAGESERKRLYQIE